MIMATTNEGGRGKDGPKTSYIEKQAAQLRKQGKAAKNVLTQMESCCYGPLSILYRSMTERLQVKVWIRSYRHIRGICTGYIVAFDMHQNLAMCDVEEVYKLPDDHPLTIRKKPRKRGGKNQRRYRCATNDASKEDPQSALPDNPEQLSDGVSLKGNEDAMLAPGMSDVSIIQEEPSDLSQTMVPNSSNVDESTKLDDTDTMQDASTEGDTGGIVCSSTSLGLEGRLQQPTTGTSQQNITSEGESEMKDSKELTDLETETSFEQISTDRCEDTGDVRTEDDDIDSASHISSEGSFHMGDMVVLDEFCETDSSDISSLSDDDGSDAELKLLQEKLADLTTLLQNLSDESGDGDSEFDLTLTDDPKLSEEKAMDVEIEEQNSDKDEIKNSSNIQATRLRGDSSVNNSGLEDGEVDSVCSDEKQKTSVDIQTGPVTLENSLSTSPRLVVKIKPIENDISPTSVRKEVKSTSSEKKSEVPDIESLIKTTRRESGTSSTSQKPSQEKISSRHDARSRDGSSDKDRSHSKDRGSDRKRRKEPEDKDRLSGEKPSQSTREETRSDRIREKDSNSHCSDKTKSRPVRDLRELLKKKKDVSQHNLRSSRYRDQERSRDETRRDQERSRDETHRHDTKESSSRSRGGKDRDRSRERSKSDYKTDNSDRERRDRKDDTRSDVSRRDRYRNSDRRKYEDTKSRRSRESDRERRGGESHDSRERDRDSTRNASSRYERESERMADKHRCSDDIRRYHRDSGRGQRGYRRSRERSGSPRIRRPHGDKHKDEKKTVDKCLSELRLESSEKEKKECYDVKDEPPPVLTRVVTESFEKFRLKECGIPPGYGKRHVNQLFIRGDNVVMVAILDHPY